MKKLLFLILLLSLITLFSCDGWNTETELEKAKKEFKIGDIVYYKLDSTKCIVQFVNSTVYPGSLDVEYKTEFGKIERIRYSSKELYFKK